MKLQLNNIFKNTFKNTLKNRKAYNMIVYIIILIITFIILYSTDLVYYTAYLIDYLLNRHSYTFKEEAQYKDNRFIQPDYFLTTFMNDYREKKLRNLPFIESQPIFEIDINELTKEKVSEISQNFTQPFVVRGLIKNFVCVKKWDLDYFEKEYGDIEVPAFSDNKSVSYSKNRNSSLKKCNSENNLCSIKEICEGIRNGDPLYINNISKLFTVSQQAQEELNLNKMSNIINESFLKEQKDCNFMSQLFLGGKNTGTSLHCAANINFFFNIKGSKHWGFIDPKHTSLIKCQTNDKGLFAISDDDFFSESERNPFLKIPRYETILHPGDFLFNPAWYWHAIKNKTDYTIGVANRFIFNLHDEMSFVTNNLFFTFLQMFSPLYYLEFQMNYLQNYFDKTKTTQQLYGNLVDREILNTISQTNTL